jgi:hypothetical protein
MTIEEFQDKPLVEIEDCIGLLRTHGLTAISKKFAKLTESRIQDLFRALFEIRSEFTHESIFDFIVAVFVVVPDCFRYGAPCSAFTLAAQCGYTRELMEWLRRHWHGLTAVQQKTVCAGLSAYPNVAEWLDLVEELFTDTRSADARTNLLAVLNGASVSRGDVRAANLLRKLLPRMETEAGAYLDQNEFVFIKKLRHDYGSRSWARCFLKRLKGS